MEILSILLIITLIVVILLIIYINDYNKLITIKIKMETSDNNIKTALKQKKEKMEILYEEIKKVCKKKNYLKNFEELKKKKLDNYELDKELNEIFLTMNNFKEDYKELNNDEFNKTLLEINMLDQNILANKKFFNKNNNALIKIFKGHLKIVAKINKIAIKNSYEIKEPNVTSSL